MTIQLIKDYDKRGEISYHIKVDGEPVPESTCYEFHDAMMIYEVEKAKRTKARTVILVQEEV